MCGKVNSVEHTSFLIHMRNLFNGLTVQTCDSYPSTDTSIIYQLHFLASIMIR